MKKHIANILTGCRIAGSILLLFLPVFSLEFYITYILCGFSDMIDGTIARKTGNISRFGEKYDAVADLVFVTSSLIKFLPVIRIPLWLLMWCGIIGIIRICNIICGYVSEKQFISLHTVMNKVTGLLLFLFPLTVSFVELEYSSAAVCSIATFSAIQEGIYIFAGRERK